MSFLNPDLDELTSAADVAAMTGAQRHHRVVVLTARAEMIVDQALRQHLDGRELVGRCVLWSGGNDSNVLAHLCRDQATHVIHCNTGIGIEATRQHVRDHCAAWGLPLIEKHPPPGCTYRDIVLRWGFPGKGNHGPTYQRLKQRAMRQARRELVLDGRRQRVLFLSGRRRDESARRAGRQNMPAIPLHAREYSVIWAAPLANWTALDLNTYRLIHGDVPVNDVTAKIHMSGECLCGSYAEVDEREEIRYWFPEVVSWIEDLEAEIADAPHIPQERKRWGWGDLARVNKLAGLPPPPRIRGSVAKQMICGSCEDRAS